MINSITVTDFQKVKDDPETFLLDVRNPDEFEYASIGGVLIPLHELDQRQDEIPKDRVIYCLCHHGVRSFHAAQILVQLGHGNIFNIEVGIDQWSNQIDNKVRKY